MRVAEIFQTIEGEAMFAGVPSVFIRTGICPFACKWCDTGFRDSTTITHEELSVPAIMSTVAQKWPTARDICLTGGEPLLERDVDILLNTLASNGYITHVETSGLVRLSSLFAQLSQKTLSKTHFIMDIKTPTSEVKQENQIGEWIFLRKGMDCLKCVIADRHDYEFVRGMIKDCDFDVYFSPCEVDGEFPNAKQLINWILEDGLRVKLSLQLHKIVGVA